MKPTSNAQRRNFLLAAGLGGAGIATAHVLKYYKTTEV